MTDPRQSNMAHPPAGEEGELDLKDILAQLLARIHWIVAAVAVGGVIGAFLGQLPNNIYRSTAVVQIEQRADRVALPAELIGDFLTGSGSGGSGLTTEVHIIRSRLVLQPVIESLNERTIVRPATAPVIGDILRRRNLPILDRYIGPEHARAGEALEAALSNLTDANADTRLGLTTLESGQYTISLPSGEVFDGRAGEPLSLPAGGTLLVSTINAPPGREYTIYEEPLRNTVARISSGLSIRERGDTGIVDFSFSGPDRSSATEILNAVIEEYGNQNLRRRAVEIDRSIEFIENQIVDVSGELREAEATLSDFRQNRQVEELSVNTRQLLDTAVEAESQLEELAFQKEQLLQVLTVNHPDIRDIELAEARLMNRLQEIRDDLGRVPDVEQELAGLVQRVEGARALDLQLRQRVEQLRILRASAVGNIRTLEPAEVAQLVGPDRRRPILVGAGVGLVLSILAALALNMLRRGVEDGRDIEALGLPLFATVNKADALVGIDAADARYGLALHDTSNVAVESLRGLRTGLKFALASAKTNSLMITSCAPSDGKSFISLNLAIVTGQTGAKVLLIDADMRRGFLRRYFQLGRHHPGLSDLLSGNQENGIVTSEAASIDFLSTGRFPPNPSELLEGPVFGEFIQQASEKYDLIVVDAPPALVVSDPGIIGQSVGMSMLVVKHLQTSAVEIQTAQKNLETTGIRLAGAILNQFDESRSRYGRYGQRYGYYYGGYRYSYKAASERD